MCVEEERITDNSAHFETNTSGNSAEDDECDYYKQRSALLWFKSQLVVLRTQGLVNRKLISWPDSPLVKRLTTKLLTAHYLCTVL